MVLLPTASGSGWDEGEASHAFKSPREATARTGKHLQFLSWGFPQEGAAMGRVTKPGLLLAGSREGKGADLGCRGVN